MNFPIKEEGHAVIKYQVLLPTFRHEEPMDAQSGLPLGPDQAIVLASVARGSCFAKRLPSVTSLSSSDVVAADAEPSDRSDHLLSVD